MIKTSNVLNIYITFSLAFLPKCPLGNRKTHKQKLWYKIQITTGMELRKRRGGFQQGIAFESLMGLVSYRR